MFRLSDEQRELREHLRRVVLEEVRPRVREMDEGCDYPHDVHQTLARHNLLGISMPRELGGRGDTELAFCIYVEELAKVSGTISLVAAYAKLYGLPVLLAGTDEQKQRFLTGVIEGRQLGSYALTEPGVGSDPAAMQTRAEKRGDVYVLNGEKRFIGNAGIADLHVVFARTGDPAPKGISAFVVDGHADGVSVEKLRTMGMPGWHLGAPRYEDVEVPVENMLGREGDGFKIAMMTFDRSRPAVAAQSTGVAQGAVDLALDYALRRETFGRPLFDHQGIQFKLAGLEAEIAAARALTFQAASFIDSQNPRLTKIAAAAKMFASDVAMKATTEAVQVLGGNGYLKDFPAERMMRDAKVLQIYEGANEIQRLVIARQMLKEASGREPIWPEMMPGAPGIEDGAGAPAATGSTPQVKEENEAAGAAA